MLIEHRGGTELDVAQLANKLRLGIRDGDEVLEHLRIELHHGDLNAGYKTIRGLQAPAKPSANLILVADASTKITPKS